MKFNEINLVRRGHLSHENNEINEMFHDATELI
jgi:hypothetical protein